MNDYAKKWINIGLKTGETDWDTFDKYMPICYAKAKLQYPSRVIRVNSPLVGALASSIAEGIYQKYGDAVGDAVDGAVGGAVDGAVRDAVHGAVGDAVDGAVGDAVDGAVRDAVDGAVRDAVDDAVDIIRKLGLSISWHCWLGGQFWVGYGWYWGVSFVNFFFDVCNLKLSKDIMERAKAYRKLCESVNYIWPNRNFVMVCARPTKINRDTQGRLHSLTEKSIEYPDHWGLYHIHGVRFEEDLWKKVVNKELSCKEVLSLNNMEQRYIALKIYGADKIFNDLGAKLIDKSDRGNELYSIDGITPHTEKILRYKCPSTGREYTKFVKREYVNADLAQAESHHFTLEQYYSLQWEA